MPAAGVRGLPHRVALQELDRRNTRFAALAAFDERLHHFEGVKVVDFRRPAVYSDNLFDFWFRGHFERRHALPERHRTAGHERNAVLLGELDHVVAACRHSGDGGVDAVHPLVRVHMQLGHEPASDETHAHFRHCGRPLWI